MPTFEIPDGPTTIDAPRSGTGPAQGSAVYSVTNTSSDSVVGRLGVKVAGGSKQEWFTLDGERERTFAPGETQTATIRAGFPPDVPQGDYPFRLRAVAVNDPDNDHAEGPMTTARLGPGTIAPPPRWWLWILLGVVALAAIAGGLFYAFGGGGESETAVKPATATKAPPPPPPAEPAFDMAKARQLAEEKTVQWVDAFNAHDVKTLVALSRPPFKVEASPLLLSEVQVREQFEGMFSPAGPGVHKVLFDSLSSMPFSDVKIPEVNGNIFKSRFGTELLGSLKVDFNDGVCVIGVMRGDQYFFLFRRTGNDVQLAGVIGNFTKSTS